MTFPAMPAMPDMPHTPDMPGQPPDDPARAAFVAWMTVFGNAQQMLKDRMRAAQAGDLGPLHLRLLTLCLETPGLTQQQLANLTCRDKGQVAHLVHALEKQGLLARSADAEDGRVWRMAVTPAGAGQALRFREVEAAVARQLFAMASAEEIDQLRALGNRIASGLNAS